MFLRRFVAFLCLFALSQVPLALASVIHEWETISLFLSADGGGPSEPVRTVPPELRRRLIAPGKKAGDVKKIRYGGLVYRFRWCPPGEFTMGSPESEGGGIGTRLPTRSD